MTRWTSRTIAAGTTAALVASIASVASSACLGALPAATQCADPSPVYAFCPPSSPIAPAGGSGGPGMPAGPAMPVPAAACTVTSEPCLLEQRAQCMCAPSAECTRTSSTCFPPPDCPAAVREQESSAQCLEPRAVLTAPQAGGPPCLCGCASCAATCDGQGPVFAGDQTVVVTLDQLASQGRLGVLIRARGQGLVTVGVRSAGFPGGAPPMILGNVSTTSTTFIDLIPQGSGSYTWRDALTRPDALELAISGPDSQLEIDCVVPYFIP